MSCDAEQFHARWRRGCEPRNIWRWFHGWLPECARIRERFKREKGRHTWLDELYACTWRVRLGETCSQALRQRWAFNLRAVTGCNLLGYTYTRTAVPLGMVCRRPVRRRARAVIRTPSAAFTHVHLSAHGRWLRG